MEICYQNKYHKVYKDIKIMLGTIALGEKKSTRGLILKGDQLPRPPLFDMSVLGLARYASRDKNDPLVTKNFQRIFCKKKKNLSSNDITYSLLRERLSINISQSYS